MKYFNLKEFNCKCCSQNKMQQPFLAKLDRARSLSGVPFYINSGFRCTKHNKEIGGAPQSYHLKGAAADISCNNQTRMRILIGLILAGFTGIGIGRNFIHVDNRKDFYCYIAKENKNVK